MKHEAVLIHDRLSGAFYDRYIKYKTDPYWNTFTYSRRKIHGVLERYLGQAKGGRLLDVGCGTGYFIRELSQRGFQCQGCDPSGEMLKHARQVNPGVEFLDASIERLPYASNSFDYVMAIEVMRYIRDAEAALGEVFRVLKPGGISLLTYAPKFSTALYPLINQITARAQILHWSKVKQYFHTTGLLNRLYGHAGFRDVEIHGRFIGPFVYLVRLSRPMGSALLRAWEPLDDRLADRPLLKNFSNIFVVAARKPSA